ncbi:MAG TPA: hypothetical protein VGA00_07740 [Acidiferrobacterales bacterium]
MHFLHIALRIQLAFFEDVTDVARNDRLIALKQLDQLRLAQPDSVTRQPHINSGTAILGAIQNYLPKFVRLVFVHGPCASPSPSGLVEAGMLAQDERRHSR